MHVKGEVPQRNGRTMVTERDEGHNSYGPGGVDDEDVNAFGVLATLHGFVRGHVPKFCLRVHRLVVSQECRSQSWVLQAFRRVALKDGLQRDLGGALGAGEIEESSAGQGFPEHNELPQVFDVFFVELCVAEANRHGLQQRSHANGRGMLPSAWALELQARGGEAKGEPRAAPVGRQGGWYQLDVHGLGGGRCRCGHLLG